MGGPRRNRVDHDLSDVTRGVVLGLVVRKPASGLTFTYEGGVVKVGNTAYPNIQDSAYDPQKSTGAPVLKVVAASTKLCTASKDTYVYIDSAGVLQITAVANNATKPVIPDGRGEWLAKVVTDGSNITGVTDLRRQASAADIVVVTRLASFETGEVGIDYVPVPFSGRILGITGVVVKTLGGTDTGTVTAAIGLNDVFTDVTTGVITGAISAAVSTRYDVYPTAANAFTFGNSIRLTAAKSTAGGRMLVTLYLAADI